MQITLNKTEPGARIKSVAERMKNPQTMLENIGLYLLSSIKQNFLEGGRPVRWKPSQRALREQGLTLIDTGSLMHSIGIKELNQRVLKIGTNKKYAAIQHFGGTIAKKVRVKRYWRVIHQAFGQPRSSRRVQVKSHSRNMHTIIPPRPFLLIQDEDWRVIKRIGHNFILKDN